MNTALGICGIINYNKRFNVCVIRIQRKRKKRVEKIFEKIITENFLNLAKHIKIQL